MKNLFLILAFSFATSLSFANSNSTDSKLEKIAESHCVTVVTSCGIYGVACGETSSDLVELAIALDEWVCP